MDTDDLAAALARLPAVSAWPVAVDGEPWTAHWTFRAPRPVRDADVTSPEGGPWLAGLAGSMFGRLRFEEDGRPDAAPGAFLRVSEEGAVLFEADERALLGSSPERFVALWLALDEHFRGGAPRPRLADHEPDRECHGFWEPFVRLSEGAGHRGQAR